MNKNETREPGVGVTLVYRIEYPKGCGPSHDHREWGRNEDLAKYRMEQYVAKLPNGCKWVQVERRIGR